MDQPEWCNDKIHNVDVRLDAYETGHLQVWDKAEGWVFASPKSIELDALEDLGNTFCRALNFEGVEMKNGHHGKPDYPAVYLDTSRDFRPSKLLECSSDAARSESFAACSVQDCVDGSCEHGALTIKCGGSNTPQMCARMTMNTVRHNHLKCHGGDEDGYELEDHERHVGAAHLVCGTAGINESRIEWFDGFQDDFTTFNIRRNPDGKLVGYEKWTGQVSGNDLLTADEYEHLQEVQDVLEGRAKEALNFLVERHKEILQIMAEKNKTAEEVHRLQLRVVIDTVWSQTPRVVSPEDEDEDDEDF
mmetsp:Transcript_16272/g.42160  ORF Transcript_16272/g.42160 Transcript_16272/m.42160 type:complete len:304 (+) Transcript_16272:3-914(+)